MNIVSWTPFQEMNRLLGRPFGGLLMGRWPASTEDIEAGESSWIPVLDVSETESEYLVRADLPAVKKEDVTVTIENDVLTIAGERKFEKAEASEKVHRRESIRGTFTRSLSLPENANASGIRAESRDGVLTVHVPKTKVERTKALEIKVQ